MKAWISIALLFSFLRLQLICCCGSIGHFDDAMEHPPSPSHLGCGYESGKCCRHAEEMKERGKHDACRCTVRGTSKKTPIKVRTDTSSVDSITPFCAHCGRSGDGQHRPHHLYWMAHGNVIPSSKIIFKCIQDPVWLTKSSWQSSIVSDQRRECPALSSRRPQADLLEWLGRWRI